MSDLCQCEDPVDDIEKGRHICLMCGKLHDKERSRRRANVINFPSGPILKIVTADGTIFEFNGPMVLMPTLPAERAIAESLLRRALALFGAPSLSAPGEAPSQAVLAPTDDLVARLHYLHDGTGVEEIGKAADYIEALQAKLTAAEAEADRRTKEVELTYGVQRRLREQLTAAEAALRPFAEFIEGTDPAWDDRRRISTLNYDFDKLTLGLFRRARDLVQGAPVPSHAVPAPRDSEGAA